MLAVAIEIVKIIPKVNKIFLRCLPIKKKLSKEIYKDGMKLLFHTNGGIAKEPLSNVLNVTDVVTVNLEGV